MRDARVGLIIVAAGVGSALIKKSKPLSRYLGDQLIRAGEYLKVGTDDCDAGSSVPTHEVAQVEPPEAEAHVEVEPDVEDEPAKVAPKTGKKPPIQTKNPKLA